MADTQHKIVYRTEPAPKKKSLTRNQRLAIVEQHNRQNYERINRLEQMFLMEQQKNMALEKRIYELETRAFVADSTDRLAELAERLIE